MSMLGKKVLLVCESPRVATSIEKMFKYFLYDVVVGLDEYKRQGSDMSPYDILVIDDKLTTEGLENLISKVKKETVLKYVLIQDSNYAEGKKRDIESAHLIKPVMQESVFELIISLFENKIENRNIKSMEKKSVIDLEKYINKSVKKEEKSTEAKRTHVSLKEDETERLILDIEIGKKYAHRVGLVYVDELSKFLDNFSGSDRYFRQVVNEKQTWKIKEFCIDLEKHAKTIGAESMSDLANQVGLLFVYNKLDMLPLYTNKYHLELTKLIAEIKIYIDQSSV
jgi:hypothetical protein